MVVACRIITGGHQPRQWKEHKCHMVRTYSSTYTRWQASNTRTHIHTYVVHHTLFVGREAANSVRDEPTGNACMHACVHACGRRAPQWLTYSLTYATHPVIDSVIRSRTGFGVNDVDTVAVGALFGADRLGPADDCDGGQRVPRVPRLVRSVFVVHHGLAAWVARTAPSVRSFTGQFIHTASSDPNQQWADTREDKPVGRRGLAHE